MEGVGEELHFQGPPENPGVNQRSVIHLFKTAAERSNDFQYTISISVLEIYNEKIR